MYGLRPLQPASNKAMPHLVAKRHVGVIAIGNALGSSFVANRVGAEQTRLNATLAASAMGQIASDHVNGKLDAQFATDQETFKTNFDKDNDKWLQQQLLSTVTDLNKARDAESAKHADQTLARIEAVNAQSAALQNHANEMQQHFDARVKYGQQSAADALQRGLNRGAYAASKNYQSQDLMAGVDVEGYINFRQGQINDFNNFKANLSGIGSFAFHTGANLFGGLINGSQALGDATALLGIQGGYAFSSAWSNVGDTLSYVAHNPVDALIVNPATAAYNRYSSIYNTDGFGAAAGTLLGDTMSGATFAAFGTGLTRLKVTGSVGESIRYEFSWDNLTKTPESLSNRNVRAWYLSQEMEIPNILDRTQPLEVQAKQAFDYRNDIRMQARDLMSDQVTANYLRMNEPNFTWDEFVSIKSTKYTGDELWQSIISSSQKSREKVNAQFGFIGDRY
jgi:hypothetical protein